MLLVRLQIGKIERVVKRMINQKIIQDIDERIKNLKAKKKRVEENLKTQNSKLISNIFETCNANTLPPEILAGALKEAVEHFQQNNEILNTWKREGTDLLNNIGGKKIKASFRKTNKADH